MVDPLVHMLIRKSIEKGPDFGPVRKRGTSSGYSLMFRVVILSYLKNCSGSLFRQVLPVRIQFLLNVYTYCIPNTRN